MEETICIERLSYGSAAIGHRADGKTVFVEGGVPGDTVRIAVDEEKPSFCTAHIVEVVEASPARVQAPCPYVDVCGGCPWQHIAYPAQLEAKRANVVSALVRTARFDPQAAESLVAAPLPSKRETGYRNKLEFGAERTDAGRFALGFRKEHSHKLFSPDTCLIAHKAIAKAPKALRGALGYLQRSQDLGIFRVGVRHSVRTHDLEIALWTEPGPFPRKAVASTLRSALPATSIVRVMADPGKIRTIKGVEALEGKGFWEEDLAGNRFRTSAPSFFQVNTAQAERLVEAVLQGLELEEGDLVADLYAGGGTFSIPLSKAGAEVLAVESAASSVRDLRRNAEANDAYVEVIGGDSARELPLLGDLDALVVDPPRTGLAKGVAESIAEAAPARVAYVSCDPATWARDVTRFQEVGYHLARVQPVDMFPQTYHTEIASIFEHRS
ncbi:23S rRNA (uracil(1939)-C(5))-methyltransferase RlmD [Raoultibacter phocaeensis]|uniref:23S rRNA (uracil(1939)-C(5))-methyltransferase RlmD n=1 Tax=Raoultibacter phocaeensis TaxID=2479841 RepID=UPI00111B5FD6|nr:23S rRNA (uracil(1939)-C(5))-methyltransferase RlmD [Raoultibacter phocaeensis]